MRLDLGELGDVASNEISGFIDRLLDILPGVAEHSCDTGERGRFLERLHRGTYLAHICEHCTVEMTNLAGIGVSYGKARWAGKGKVYNVIVRYEAEHATRYLLRQAVALLEAILAGQPFDLATVLREAAALAAEKELGPSTRAIIDAAERRGIQELIDIENRNPLRGVEHEKPLTCLRGRRSLPRLASANGFLTRLPSVVSYQHHPASNSRGSSFERQGGEMEVTISQEQGRVPVTVFHIKGELTADTAAPFQAEVKAAIENGTRNLVLDLTDCGFIGSFGIRAINDALIAMYQANGLNDADVRKALRSNTKASYLKLVNPNAQVKKVLETSGFDMLLEVHRGLAESVASFG